jgi:16S rRNA (guanine966-N2)-methyltransferase
MRVIAGQLGGRIFASPHGHRTHPMSDKARGALFNMLGDISGYRVLDAFAGSGALSFEAVSRGAANVIAVEIDKKAQRTIKENIELLQVEDQVTLVSAHIRAWLNRRPPLEFDIVLLDPPYDDLQYKVLERLAGAVAPGGRIVLSWPPKERLLVMNGCELISSKNYGDISLHTYQRVD